MNIFQALKWRSVYQFIRYRIKKNGAVYFICMFNHR